MSPAESAPSPTRRADYQAPAFTAAGIELDVVLGEDETLVTTRSRFERQGDGDLVLHGEGLDLRSISVDGAELAADRYVHTDNQLTISMVGASIELMTTVALKPQDNTELSGLYKSSGTFCTQCEAEGFRRITFFLDRPDVMTTYRTTITAERERYPVLLSNGNRLSEEDLGDGRHRVVWEDPHTKPSYLFALVAGDLHCHTGTYTTIEGREVRCEIWVEHRNADKCEHALRSLQKSMQWDEEVFGRAYDLDIYMIVAVDDFNMGAMENKGLNVFNSKYVLARPDTATDDDYEHIEAVIAHEYFHNWTGNRVTCRDWFQLTLKEGLTVFRDQQFTADMTSAAVKRIDDVQILRAHQFTEDAGPMAHPVRPEQYVVMDNFYTATVYNKGAEVIRMYHSLLGAEGFRQGMDLYFERHDGQAVTCDDFRAAMADANDRDLTAFENWYLQSGTPKLTISGTYDATAKTYSLAIEQTGAVTAGRDTYAPMHLPLRTALLGRDGSPLTSALAGNQAHEHIIEVDQLSQTIELTEVEQEPVPSLLRDFSAPVTLECERSEDDLVFLMQHETDAFNRWEAGQLYAERLLLSLVADHQAGRDLVVPEAFVTAFSSVLLDAELDDALKAQALILPVERILAQRLDVIDPDAIHLARVHVRKHLAEALRADFRAAYDARFTTDYVVDKPSIAARRLKNTCLGYLCAGDKADGIALARHQFDACSNMTDRQAALGSLCSTTSSDRDACLAAFLDQWRDDPLVVDKWFSLQAVADRADTVEQVIALADHEAFTLLNPNRARSLVASFAVGNQAHFHRADGAGYSFVGDQIVAICGRNPQLAARLTSAFNYFKRFDAERQALQRAQLERIKSTEGCAKDVLEIVDRALG